MIKRTTEEGRILRLAERAVRRMKPLDREIFIAIRVRGASQNEVARRYELTIEEVQDALVRALGILSDVMEGHAAPWWRFWHKSRLS